MTMTKMNQRAINWALGVMATFGAEQGAIALYILARNCDEDGVVARTDMAALAQGCGMKPDWFLNGLQLLEDGGLIDGGVRRPRAVETMYVIGPTRLRLDLSWHADTCSVS